MDDDERDEWDKLAGDSHIQRGKQQTFEASQRPNIESATTNGAAVALRNSVVSDVEPTGLAISWMSEPRGPATTTPEPAPLKPHLPTPAVTPTDSESQSPIAGDGRTALATENKDEHEHKDDGDENGQTFPAFPAVGDIGKLKDLRVDTSQSYQQRPRKESGSKQGTQQDKDKVRRLSASKMQELAASPESLPVASILDRRIPDHPLSAGIVESAGRADLVDSLAEQTRPLRHGRGQGHGSLGNGDALQARFDRASTRSMDRPGSGSVSAAGSVSASATPRPGLSPRTVSTPPINRRKSSSTSQQGSNGPVNRRNSFHPAPRSSQGHGSGQGSVPPPLNLESSTHHMLNSAAEQQQQQQKPPSDAATSDSQPQQQAAAPPAQAPAAVSSLPLPPMSVPTFLQLELAGQRPSPLYIHHSYSSDIPYESSAVKIERLKNFLLLPSFLERTILFGALACLDAWLWTFTILPMRFVIAVSVLVKWWSYLVGKEARWAIGYVWYGIGRWWRRGGSRGRAASRASQTDRGGRSSAGEESRSPSRVREPLSNNMNGGNVGTAAGAPTVNGTVPPASAPVPRRTHSKSHYGHGHGSGSELGLRHGQPQTQAQAQAQAQTQGHKHGRGQGHGHRHTTSRHRRTQSVPSGLTSFHKADILQGFVIIVSSLVLMRLDASRMYHFIRAQSAIKLYVIYNGLEVGDRLLSALGQDLFECLFSEEVLSRDSLGRSKVLLPFGMFCLALVYNVVHATALFYQVITLNVAVNSYSNALLTLLISNQFVEIKSSVFKRFEKENTFQLTCADIVERFQLWVMLLIIAMRNIVEVGGWTVPGAGSGGSGVGDSPAAKIPLHSASILPASFTALPTWFWSGEVLSPFLIVTASETIVDWIKHAYINKFNNIKPNFYSRVLDILCKDYYTNAFVTPSLTRRLGLPLIPLSCLFIRASVQTYHMLLATHLPAPLPQSTQTALAVESSSSATPSSPAMAAALDRLDTLIRNALGRAVHGLPYNAATAAASSSAGHSGNATGAAAAFAHGGPTRILGSWTTDDAVAAVTMLTVFSLALLVLLVVKLLLGMALLRYSRGRYAAMRASEAAVAAGRAEADVFDQKGSRRVGGFGHVEVGEERRAWIYEDDPEGLRKAVATERRNAGKRERSDKDLGRISRYEMVAKRIW